MKKNSKAKSSEVAKTPSVIAIDEWIPVPPDPVFPGKLERCWVTIPPGAWQLVCVRSAGQQYIQGTFHAPSVVGATRPVAPVGQRVEYVLVQIA